MECPQNTLTSNTIVAHLSDIFGHSGAQQYLGEPVTMAQHMLQAASLADQQGVLKLWLPRHSCMTLAISLMISAHFLWQTLLT